jgi:mono/diheme cytochrome c family protein
LNSFTRNIYNWIIIMKKSAPQFKLGFISTAVALLTACGGGGDVASDDYDKVLTTPVTTTVMDGLIKDATVCVDVNSNGVCDPSELKGQTDASGRVTLNIPTAQVVGAKLIALVKAGVSFDVDTGWVAISYTLKSVVGKTEVISPLTHMVQTKMETDAAKGTATTLAAAESYVKAQTGVTVPLFDNFIAKRDTDADYKNAGLVARLIVVSAQKLEAPDDLVNRLNEIKTKASEVSQLSCATGNIIKDCDDEMQAKALVEKSPLIAPTAAPTMAPTTVPTARPTAAPTAAPSIAPTAAPTIAPTAAPTPAPTAAPRVAQTISFTQPSAQTMGAAPSALSVSSSSGLSVTLASSTTGVCTVSGSAMTLVSTGSCTITANQAGNTGYAAAAAIARTFTVSPAAVVVSAAAAGKIAYTSNSVMSCAGCHGMPPSTQKVLKGANSPSTILKAINAGTGGMGMYIGKLSTQQLSDMAAYLATPNL